MQLKASLRSGQNFEVSDCDLWSTWSVFHSSGPVGGRYGLMTRNQIYNGGSCHWFVSCGCPPLDILMRGWLTRVDSSYGRECASIPDARWLSTGQWARADLREEHMHRQRSHGDGKQHRLRERSSPLCVLFLFASVFFPLKLLRSTAVATLTIFTSATIRSLKCGAMTAR